MRRTVLFSAAILLAFSGVSVSDPLAIGASIPAAAAGVKMENIDGSMMSISDARGKVGTVVAFSCNHCPWVVAWEERMAELLNSAPEHGIGVIVINSNDIEKYPADSLPNMKKRAGERGFEFAYVVDSTSDVARAFGATRTPEFFLFDGEGKLVYHGALDDNAEHPDQVERTYLADAMQVLVSGGEIDPTQTRAIGCTIKFREKAE